MKRVFYLMKTERCFMKFSVGSIQVLNSFASIQPAILFRKDSDVIMTADTAKSMFASAKIQESMDTDVAIYDLPQFLNTLKLFSDYDFKPYEDYGIISFPENNSSMRYVFAHPSIINAPEKNISFPEHEIEFTLPKHILKAIIKVSGQGMQNLVIQSTDTSDKISLKVMNFDSNSTNTSNNEWNVELPASIQDGLGDFSVILYISALAKFLDRDYNVKVSSKKICSFEAVNAETDIEKSYDISYYVAMAIDSIIG